MEQGSIQIVHSPEKLGLVKLSVKEIPCPEDGSEDYVRLNVISRGTSTSMFRLKSQNCQKETESHVL